MSYLALFAEFFKIGLFAIGGGLATLPFLFRLTTSYERLSLETLGSVQAIAQSSPGAIGVNMAAATGLYIAGIPGAIIAALGLVCPSIIIIVIIARALSAFKESKTVAAVFAGLRPGATGLLAAAFFSTLKSSLFNSAPERWYEALYWRQCVLFAILFLFISRCKLHPIIYIACAGIVGVLGKW
jgi:chromate transporter